MHAHNRSFTDGSWSPVDLESYTASFVRSANAVIHWIDQLHMIRVYVSGDVWEVLRALVCRNRENYGLASPAFSDATQLRTPAVNHDGFITLHCTFTGNVYNTIGIPTTFTHGSGALHVFADTVIAKIRRDKECSQQNTRNCRR